MLDQQALSIGTFQRLKRPLEHKGWQAKVPLSIMTKRFEVGVCNNDSELWESLSLRDEVFKEAFPFLTKQLDGLDALDPYSDILFVRELEQGRIIASYRLIQSQMSPCFYSSEEFDLTDFLHQEGAKLELSRACIKESFRNGVVLHLLWRGVAAYMLATKSRYLFGLTSIQSYDLNVIFDLYSYFKAHNHVGEDFTIEPNRDNHLLNWYSLRQCLKKDAPAKLPPSAPPLLKAYLKAGAKIYGAPAVDSSFGCFDFFTVLAFDDIAASHSKKYLNI